MYKKESTGQLFEQNMKIFKTLVEKFSFKHVNNVYMHMKTFYIHMKIVQIVDPASHNDCCRHAQHSRNPKIKSG